MVIIDGYKIDAAVSEGHTFSSTVSQYPMESGATVTDHVRLNPVKVVIQGIVSDTPIGVIGDERGTLGTQIAEEVGALPSMDGYDRLARIWFAREPVSIETSLQNYGNMILESLDAPRSSKDGDSFRFTATFKQIQIVTNERTFIKVAVPRATKKKNKGTVPAKKKNPLEYWNRLNGGDKTILKSLLG